MGSRSTTNWVQESNRIDCFINRSATHFELFKIKISEFGIPLDSNGVIYDMNHTLSIKEIFRLCILKRKGFRWLEIYSNLKFFRNFLFQSMGMGSYYLYRWILRKTRPFFLFWFLSLFTLQRRSRFVKCIHTFYEKWYRDSGCLTRDWAIIRSCLGRVTYWAFALWILIWERRFMLYRLISYHGSGVKNGWGFPSLIPFLISN